MLIELQTLYASMDEIDAASGILLLKKGSEESLADAAFRHKINGRLNESIACIEQMLESNESAKHDIKQHETYIRTFINVGRHRNALSYLDGLMNDRAEWKEALDSYRIEACWKLGSWDKLRQVVNANKLNGMKNSSTSVDLSDDGSGQTGVTAHSLQGKMISIDALSVLLEKIIFSALKAKTCSALWREATPIINSTLESASSSSSQTNATKKSSTRPCTCYESSRLDLSQP